MWVGLFLVLAVCDTIRSHVADLHWFALQSIRRGGAVPHI